MWFRTALLLFLLLLVIRFIRDVAARLKSPPSDGRTADTGFSEGSKPSGAGKEGPSAANWPPGEITDVEYRESRTADRE
ncbi:MAG TPA: hypothetical protein VF720_06710 [Candidatus Eisenbacteria bacterium]